jgi:hypothetical protein
MAANDRAILSNVFIEKDACLDTAQQLRKRRLRSRNGRSSSNRALTFDREGSKRMRVIGAVFLAS